jgi:hypothetical protein
MERALVRQNIRFTQTQADTDTQLLALWLHGRPASTQEAYERDIAGFLVFVDKPLREVTLGDVQEFADSLNSLLPAALSSFSPPLHFRENQPTRERTVCEQPPWLVASPSLKNQAQGRG